MGGLAFLPWEEWAARAIHRLAVALKRLLYRTQRRRSLSRSTGWPETEGTVESIQWDTSFPREEVSYSFETGRGKFSGYNWVWFESPNDTQFHVGDTVAVRYLQDDPSESVLLKLK